MRRRSDVLMDAILAFGGGYFLFSPGYPVWGHVGGAIFVIGSIWQPSTWRRK